MKTGFEAVRFGWLVFVIPFLFVFSNTLLMDGLWYMIVFDFVVAMIGVWFGAAGVTGYSMRVLNMGWRLTYFIAGLCLIMPLHAFPVAKWFNLAGAILAVSLLVYEFSLRGKGKLQPAGG